MSRITGNFNKLTSDDLERVVSRASDRLVGEPREIFDTFHRNGEADIAKSREQVVEEGRMQRIATMASRFSQHGPSPMDGGSSQGEPVFPNQVKALFDRAEREQMPPEQVTAHSQVEEAIHKALPQNEIWERKWDEQQKEKQLKLEMKLLNELGALENSPILKH